MNAGQVSSAEVQRAQMESADILVFSVQILGENLQNVFEMSMYEKAFNVLVRLKHTFVMISLLTFYITYLS